MFSKIEIKITSDGSTTLYLPEIDEHYHSINGAINESKHVYISAGFNYCKKKNISIFEVGFGTGLNALLTYLEAKRENRTVSYYSIDILPLNKDIVEKLNFSKILHLNSDSEKIFKKLHSSLWDNSNIIDENFILKKIHGDIHKDLPDKKFDLIYFDAFGPDKQPDVWNQLIFNQIFYKLNSGGILTTYCAKGVVKRMLIKAGFVLESLPGPLGKREIIRAVKV